jgi:thiamine pyrophosphate-dependent acetolactate synthase large subunit-like protein
MPQGTPRAGARASGSTTSAKFVLDRAKAVPAVIGNHKDFLFVTGLAGTAKDIAHLTNDGANAYALAGAMGAAVMMGLGLALARPDRRVLVATGDGELLMNVGALATVSVLNPPNLSILCVDNGHYGETGYQLSHTSQGVDLEKMAAGAGIRATCTVEQEGDIANGARLLRESNGASFVLLRVKPEDGPKMKRLLDPAAARVRFRLGLTGQA